MFKRTVPFTSSLKFTFISLPPGHCPFLYFLYCNILPGNRQPFY
uniref:Uncharacterized protein n=1 Tax=Siphoviridae sp. ctaDn21 TaxID=2825563 RepID=A0A8S5UUY6_9CAUD|nr:MAG TPA: hypothetical protein [Siphoviridae sp. ctaDn21]